MRKDKGNGRFIITKKSPDIGGFTKSEWILKGVVDDFGNYIPSYQLKSYINLYNFIKND